MTRRSLFSGMFASLVAAPFARMFKLKQETFLIVDEEYAVIPLTAMSQAVQQADADLRNTSGIYDASLGKRPALTVNRVPQFVELVRKEDAALRAASGKDDGLKLRGHHDKHEGLLGERG
jgi:hypothetical protein